MTIEFTVLISIVSAIVGIFVGTAGYRRTANKDLEAAARSDGAVLNEIGYIKAGIDDIKAEQRDQRKTNQELISRLTAVEASSKQAHKRIDALEGKASR